MEPDYSEQSPQQKKAKIEKEEDLPFIDISFKQTRHSLFGIYFCAIMWTSHFKKSVFYAFYEIVQLVLLGYFKDPECVLNVLPKDVFINEIMRKHLGGYIHDALYGVISINPYMWGEEAYAHIRGLSMTPEMACKYLYAAERPDYTKKDCSGHVHNPLRLYNKCQCSNFPMGRECHFVNRPDLKSLYEEGLYYLYRVFFNDNHAYSALDYSYDIENKKVV